MDDVVDDKPESALAPTPLWKMRTGSDGDFDDGDSEPELALMPTLLWETCNRSEGDFKD